MGPGAGLVDCVVQLASHATVERILRRTPDDEPLPSLSLNVEGDVGAFEHAEGADFAEEALSFCSRVVREERSKTIVKNCARNLKAQARRKVTQLVDEQTDERRKAIEQAVDAFLAQNPDRRKRANDDVRTVKSSLHPRAAQANRSIQRLHLLVHRGQRLGLRVGHGLRRRPSTSPRRSCRRSRGGG